MTRFVACQDIHLSDRTPVSRLDNYREAIKLKLEQVLKLATSHKVKASAILIAGDVFNEKSVPISLIYWFMDWCIRARNVGIRVIGIPGNHDLRFDRYDSLPVQPLGIIFRSGVMEDASFTLLDVDGVAVGGIPYPDAKTISLYDSLPNPLSHRSILLAHAFATVEGGEYFGEPVLRYADLLPLPFGVFIFGHDHRDHGVVVINDRWFVNVGALSRGSISQENIDRAIQATIIEFGDSTRVYPVKLSYRPSAEVFDLVLREQKKRETSMIERFVDQISDDLLADGAVSFTEKLKVMDIPDKVREKVTAYITAAEIE